MKIFKNLLVVIMATFTIAFATGCGETLKASSINDEYNNLVEKYPNENSYTPNIFDYQGKISIGYNNAINLMDAFAQENTSYTGEDAKKYAKYQIFENDALLGSIPDALLETTEEGMYTILLESIWQGYYYNNGDFSNVLLAEKFDEDLVKDALDLLDDLSSDLAKLEREKNIFINSSTSLSFDPLASASLSNLENYTKKYEDLIESSFSFNKKIASLLGVTYSDASAVNKVKNQIYGAILNLSDYMITRLIDMNEPVTSDMLRISTSLDRNVFYDYKKIYGDILDSGMEFEYSTDISAASSQLEKAEQIFEKELAVMKNMAGSLNLENPTIQQEDYIKNTEIYFYNYINCLEILVNLISK